MTPDELLEIHDEHFRQVVNDDLRRTAHPTTVAALRSPAVFDRWWGTLIAMSKSVDGQLGSRREEYLSSHASLLRGIKRVRKDIQRNKRRGNEHHIEAGEDRLADLEDELLKLLEDYHHARAGSLRFKSGLDEWLAEAATIRRMRRREP